MYTIRTSIWMALCLLNMAPDSSSNQPYSKTWFFAQVSETKRFKKKT